MSRKICATISGYIYVPVRASSKVTITIDEGEDIVMALRDAAKGEVSGEGWDLVDGPFVSSIEDDFDVDEAIEDCDNDLKFEIDNVEITDSK